MHGIYSWSRARGSTRLGSMSIELDWIRYVLMLFLQLHTHCSTDELLKTSGMLFVLALDKN